MKRENARLKKEVITQQSMLVIFENDLDAREQSAAKKKDVKKSATSADRKAAPTTEDCTVCEIKQLKLKLVEKQLKAAQDELATLSAERENNQKRIDELLEEIGKLNGELDEKKNIISTLQSQIAELKIQGEKTREILELHGNALTKILDEGVVIQVGQMCMDIFEMLLSAILTPEEMSKTLMRKWWNYEGLQKLLRTVFTDNHNHIDETNVQFHLWLFKKIAPQLGLPQGEKEQNELFAAMGGATEFRHGKAHPCMCDLEMPRIQGYVETFVRDLDTFVLYGKKATPKDKTKKPHAYDSENRVLIRKHLRKAPTLYMACQLAELEECRAPPKMKLLYKFYTGYIQGKKDAELPTSEVVSAFVPILSSNLHTARECGLISELSDDYDMELEEYCED